VRFILFGSLKNYLNLLGFPVAFISTYQTKFHHRLWRLPYTEVLVCHKQQVEVFHSNLSIERSWVPFRCWVSLFLTEFTSFGIRAWFLVQVCLSFNIFHSFVSALAVHIIYLFLVEFPLPYLFNLCLFLLMSKLLVWSHIS
jgi:hypothetical protein